MPSLEIQWEAPEFEHRPKDVSWFWASILVTISILAFAVWQKNFLFAFFVVIAEMLVLVWGAREPETARFRLSEKGLTINERKQYAWVNIAHFSFDQGYEETRWDDIVLHFRNHPRPALRVLLPKEKSAAIRNAFRAMLPEIEHEESLMDAVERFLRF